MTPFRMNPVNTFSERDFLREYVRPGSKPAKGKYKLLFALPDGVEVALATSLREGGGATLVVHTPSGAKRHAAFVVREGSAPQSLREGSGGQMELELVPGSYRVEVGGRNVFFTLKK